MTTQNKYSPGSVVYYRESAAMGFLEAVSISGVHLSQNGWLYSVSSKLQPPTFGALLDRRNHVSTQIMYFTEDEFVELCEAVQLVEANAKLAYDNAKTMRQTYCPDSMTEG